MLIYYPVVGNALKHRIFLSLLLYFTEPEHKLTLSLLLLLEKPVQCLLWILLNTRYGTP